MNEPQQEVAAFLRDPGSYPPGAGPVDLIETHASLVFLAGRYAYKLKRAVKYPYLDFSTAALRQAACGAELRLNRRTAPQLYLEVRAIGRRPDGRLAWGRDGEPVDFVVVMRRFAERDLLDNLAREGGLTAPLLYALTAHIATFHAKAEICPERGGAAAMRAIADTAVAVLRQCGAAGFPAGQVDRIAAAITGEWAPIAARLDERRDTGKVRRVHGDLHLRNVCLVDGRPLLFDCLEFSDDLACIDVLYDLAFLLMDFGHRGLRGDANLVLNRYLDLTEEDDGLAAMPYFVALRAAIRSHIVATMAQHGWGGSDPAHGFAEARLYLDEAEAVLAPAAPRLVAVGGPSGSGKSTLAVALAPGLGRVPGARVLRSDVLRKLRFATAPEEPLPPDAYTPEVNELVYADLRRRAATALAGGFSAIIDAVALREDERRSFAEVAAAAGVPFTGLWLDAPEEAMRQRLGARGNDASDASAAVLAQQLAAGAGAADWTRIPAGGAAEAALSAARRALLH